MPNELAALRKQLNIILPALYANRGMAYDEWMDGEIARGAFEYCQQRVDLALTILQITDDEVISVDQAYAACAMMIVDLRAIVKDRPEYRNKLNAYIRFYRKAGYTDNHKLFNIPVKPITSE